MTPEQKQILRQTWAQIVPIGDTAATLFYNRLFAIDPSTRKMFSSVDLRAQRSKLLQALGHIIDGLDQFEALLPMLKQLGRRHSGYGVRDEHYDSVGDALLWALKRGLKDSWTPAVKDAWIEIYTMIASVMRHASVDVAAASGAPVTATNVLDGCKYS